LIILGLSHLSPSPIGHDSTAALIVNGKLQSAVSEERFSRVKHDGGYQANAIKFCLEEAGIRLSDVDRVAVGFGLDKQFFENSNNSGFSSRALTDQKFRKTPIEKLNPFFHDHQYIHARTGYSLSGFQKAVIISLDGRGYDEGKSSSGGIYLGNKANIEPLILYPGIASLGFVYGCLTEICGFRMNDGEGKTMTLAAFGENKPDSEKTKIYQHMKNLFPKFDREKYLSGGVNAPIWKFNHNMTQMANVDQRVCLLGKIFDKKLIAWAAQKRIEEIVFDIIIGAVEMTGIKNVVLSGGVFLNMIMNMKIREKLGKKFDFFFNPICGDHGNAVGVAFEELFLETGENPSFGNMPLYLGPSYSDDEVKIAIRKKQTFRVKKQTKFKLQSIY